MPVKAPDPMIKHDRVVHPRKRTWRKKGKETVNTSIALSALFFQASESEGFRCGAFFGIPLSCQEFVAGDARADAIVNSVEGERVFM
jgi:hypothetical protein